MIAKTKYQSNCYTLSFQESKDLQVSLPKNEEIEDGLSETSVEQPQSAQQQSKNVGRMFFIFITLQLIYVCLTTTFLGFYNQVMPNSRICYQSYGTYFCYVHILDSLKTYGLVQLMPFMAFLALIFVLKKSIPNKVQYLKIPIF